MNNGNGSQYNSVTTNSFTVGRYNNNGASSTFSDWDRELSKLVRDMDAAARLEDDWTRQRQERLAVEGRMARVASRDSTRRTVQTRSRARGEPERRAAISVRQFAQRVR